LLAAVDDVLKDFELHVLEDIPFYSSSLVVRAGGGEADARGLPHELLEGGRVVEGVVV